MTIRTHAIYIIIIAVVLFLLFRSCGQRATVLKEAQRAQDSLMNDARAAREEKTRDSLAYVWRRDSLDLALQEQKDNAGVLLGEVRRNETEIKKLIARIRGENVTNIDTSTSIAECCAVAQVLADSTERLMTQYYELEQAAYTMEDNYQQQLANSDTALAQAFRAFERVSRNFDTCVSINNKLIRDLRRAGLQVYAGVSGIYSPAIAGLGGSVMLKTARDKLYGVSYYITNNKPVYEARALFKISFRR